MYLLKKKLNKLPKKVEAISTKGLTKYLRNEYKTLNGATSFFPQVYKIV